MTLYGKWSASEGHAAKNPWGLWPSGFWPCVLPTHSIHHDTPSAFPNIIPLYRLFCPWYRLPFIGSGCNYWCNVLDASALECTVIIVQSTLYRLQCTVYSLQKRTVYSSVQFTVYSVHCALYSGQLCGSAGHQGGEASGSTAQQTWGIRQAGSRIKDGQTERVHPGDALSDNVLYVAYHDIEIV